MEERMSEDLPAVYEEPQDTMVVAREPDMVLAEAQKAAKALTDVLSKKKKKVIFNGEQYLEFEDWQTVGRFYGISVQADDADQIVVAGIDGFKAKARAFHGDRQISSAVAYCMRDEPNWKNKPNFQLASMAQTRASAKALRNVLSWVVVLAGYKPTPAEEMEGVVSDSTSPPKSSGKGGEGVKQESLPSTPEEDEVALQEYLEQLCRTIAKLETGKEDNWRGMLKDLTMNKEGKYGKTKVSEIPLEMPKRGGGTWSPLKAAIEKAEKHIQEREEMNEKDVAY